MLWLLIGLWHGIDWNYLFYGIWFFAFSLLEWLVSLQRRETRSPAWHIYVLFVVGVSWIFLRCNNAGESLNFLSNLLGVNGNGVYSELAIAFLRENWHVLIPAIVFCTPVGEKFLHWLRQDRSGPAGIVLPFCYIAILAALLVLSCIYLTRTGSIPFVYR